MRKAFDRSRWRRETFSDASSKICCSVQSIGCLLKNFPSRATRTDAAGSEEHLAVKVDEARSMDAALGKALLSEGGAFDLIECWVDQTIDGSVSRRQLCDGLVVGLCDAQLYANIGGRFEGGVVDTGRGEQQSTRARPHDCLPVDRPAGRNR